MTKRSFRGLAAAFALVAILATACEAQAVEAGWYLIFSAESGLAVSVDGSDINLNSANVQQHPYSSTGLQIWIWWIEQVDGGQYKIIQRQGGKAMIVDGSTMNQTVANVKQYTYEPQSAHHRWWIEDAGDGFVRIRNVHSRRCLEVASASHVDGANIQQGACHTGGNQLWRLDRVLECPQAEEPDGSMELAHELGFLPGDLCMYGRISGNKDFFAFELAIDCMVSLSTSSNENGDTVLTLFDADGKPIDSNDDAHGTLQSFLEKCLPAGKYFVSVRGINKEVSFDYELAIWSGQPCSPP